jgi:hypothetical protein
LPTNLIVISSAFAVSGGVDTHVSSTWQLSTLADFSTVEQTLIDSTTSLTSWSVSNLTKGTLYYVRVKYKGVTYGESNWSAVSSFTVRLARSVPTFQQVIYPIPKTSNALFARLIDINENGNCLTAARVAAGNYLYIDILNGTWVMRDSVNTGSTSVYNWNVTNLSMDDLGKTVVVSTVTSGSQDMFVLSINSSGDWIKTNISSPVPDITFGKQNAISDDGTELYVSSNSYIYVYKKNVSGVWYNDNYFTYTVAADSYPEDQFFGDHFAASGNGSKFIVDTPDARRILILDYVASVVTLAADITITPPVGYRPMDVSLYMNSAGTVATISVFYEKNSQPGLYDEQELLIYEFVSGNWSLKEKVNPKEFTAYNPLGNNISINKMGDRVSIVLTGYSYMLVLSKDGNEWVSNQLNIPSSNPSINTATSSSTMNGNGDIILLSSPEYDYTDKTDMGIIYVYR